MDIAVGSVIEESIQVVNERTPCLYNGYFATNVNQPTEEDIQDYLTDLWEKG